MDNSGVLAIDRQLCWGAKVSYVFRSQVVLICKDLRIEPDYLMACMAFETGETFQANVRNMAGSPAIGLIQFMPQTAIALGTTSEKLAAMYPVTQLEYVHKYFAPLRGKLRTLADVYMAILWPAAIGKKLDYVLFSKHHPVTKRYVQNSGLDYNANGEITKAEACKKVTAAYDKGMLPGNLYVPKGP